MSGPQVRSSTGQAGRLVIGVALIAFLIWFLVQTITSGAAAVIIFGFFFLLYVGIDLSQRRRHRFLAQLRGAEPVAFVLREPSSWETGWITSSATTIGLWRSAKRQSVPVPVIEVDRSAVTFEPAVLPVSNFHQRPGLRMLVNGEQVAEFWLLHDRHGVFRRRLRDAEQDQAVERLLGSVEHVELARRHRPMNLDDSLEAIEVGGFAEWLPVPLEKVNDGYIDDIVEHFADDPIGEDIKRAMLTELAELGLQLAATSNDDALMLAAWSLLPPGGQRLELRGMVVMTCRRVAEGTTPDEFIQKMASEVSLYQSPDVEVLDTTSGPAHFARLRHVEKKRWRSDVVSEIVVCFWLPADLPGVAIVISSMLMPDLVAAAELAVAMRPLAESVAGV